MGHRLRAVPFTLSILSFSAPLLFANLLFANLLFANLASGDHAPSLPLASACQEPGPQGVAAFLAEVFERCRAAHNRDGHRRPELPELGIEGGGYEAMAFERAAFRAHALALEHGGSAGAGYERELGRIYNQLVFDLEVVGFPVERLEQHLHEWFEARLPHQLAAPEPAEGGSWIAAAGLLSPDLQPAELERELSALRLGPVVPYRGTWKRGWWVYDRESIPMAELVDSFFDTVVHSFLHEGPWRQKLLDDLDLAGNEQAATILLRTALLGEAWSTDFPRLEVLDGEDYTRAQTAYHIRANRRLGKLYRELLVELRRAGYPAERIEEYIDKEERQMSLKSSAEPGLRNYIEDNAFFEEGEP